MSDLPFFGRADVTIGGVAVSVSRTGYSGDLGYELWMPFEEALPVWDALIAAGNDYTLRVAGMEALDVARILEQGERSEYWRRHEQRLPALASQRRLLRMRRPAETQFHGRDEIGRAHV